MEIDATPDAYAECRAEPSNGATPPACGKGVTLASFARLAARVGSPVDSALRRAKLPRYYGERLWAWFPYPNIRRFAADLARREGIRDLGARAAMASADVAIDPNLRASLAGSPTLRHALLELARKVPYQSTHLQIWLERDGDVVRLCHRNHVGPEVPGYGILESYTTTLLAIVVREFCGQKWLPLRVLSRRCDTPCIGSEMPFPAMDVPVLAHPCYGGFEIPAELMHSPNRRPGLPATTPQSLPPPGTVSQALRSCLDPYILEGTPRIELAAELMSLSVRRTQRALARESTSFREILSQAKRDAAMSELAHGQASITDIAHRLGFSEQSAFCRAFRGWTGVPPSAYRTRLQSMRAA